MTENEAKEMLQEKLSCMDLEDLACIEKGCSRDCENCEHNYAQGTRGEQEEALKIAVKTLEEIQQYRSIGIVAECKKAMEKQRAKPLIDDTAFGSCPNCHSEFNSELVKELRSAAEVHKNNNRYMVNLLNSSADTIEALSAKLSAANLEQSERCYGGGWISCKDRLPEDDAKVLVWFEYFRYGEYNRLFQTIGISYMYGGKWSGFVNDTSGWDKLRIIAWQPLPQPYHELSQADPPQDTPWREHLARRFGRVE